MKRGVGALLYILLLFGSGSCSKESFFGDTTPQEPDAKVLTIVDGTILGTSSEIPLSLTVTTDLKKKEIVEPYALSASIQTLDGTEVATVTIDKVEPTTGPLPSLVPPNLPTGTYTLIVTLKKGQTQAFQNRVTFFVEEGSYELERISLFPPSVLPFSTAIVRVALRIPPQADPLIRWTIQGKVVQEKLYSQGGSELQWSSPGKEGVYPVRVELFPRPPKEGTTYSFSSPLYLTSQLVVSSMVGLQDTDLQPEAAHWSLFHFMGNLKDSGYRKNKVEYGKGHVKETGSPQVMLKGTVFGYYLDGKSGFFMEQPLLPFGLESPFEGFTIRFRLRPEEPVGGRTWFETKAKDGTCRLIIRTNSEKKMEALLEVGSSSVLLQSKGLVQESRAQLVELSFILTGNIVQAKWSLDGSTEEPVGKLELPEGKLVSSAQEGVSWIGRAEEGNGFVGVLDEFGIRIEKPSASSKESEAKIPIQTEGGVGQVDSTYILSPESSLQWGPIELASIPKEIILFIEPLGTARMEIRLTGRGRDTPWVIIHGKDGKWEIASGGKVFTLSPPTGDTIKFFIRKQKQTITVTWNEVSVSVSSDSVEPEAFSIQIYHAAEAVHPLKIKGIKILEQN